MRGSGSADERIIQFQREEDDVPTAVENAQWYIGKRDASGAIRALQAQGTKGAREDFEAVASLAAEVRTLTSREREQTQCAALMEHARTSLSRLERESAAATAGSAPVCPHCGTPARGVVHCPMCGADLTSTSLITKAEWERRSQTEPALPGSAHGTKACPRCAEEVKLAAVICRFCSYQFDKSVSSGTEPAQPAATSGVAIAAFLTSLVGLWFAGIPLGIHAQDAIDRSAGRLTGRGFATAGIVLGVLGIIGTAILIAIIVSAAQNNPGCTYTYQATGGCVPGT
jgi:hypothetical protein